MDETEAQVVDDIATYGWHMITVPEDDEGPGFTYTIGLFKSYDHPEVIVFGLPKEIMQGIVDTVAALVKGGQRFSDGDQSNEVVDGYTCAFRAVHGDRYDEHFGYAIWFYRSVGTDNFPALQCIWPDKAHKFPWEPACDAGIRDLQPLLFEAAE